MGSRELIESLNREADERARSIRDDAEAEARRILGEAREKAEALARECRAEQERAARARTAEIVLEAKGEPRALKARSSAELVGRLRDLAFSCLGELRASNYEGVFRGLAAEIPANDWEVVRVNPADVKLASDVFGGLRVQGDAGITGGMEAASGGGLVQVVNTFEKRLERAWEELLPGLLREVYETCGAGD